MLLGLTGLYCSGKNFVGGILEQKGFAVLDVDKLGHTALENQKEVIAECFGKGILDADGTVNRRTLGKCVFSRPDKLAELEAIVHPEVNELTLSWIDVHGGVPCVINAALLHRSSAFTRLSAIIFVRAPYLSRLLRAKKRDGLSWKEIMRRINSQEFGVYYRDQKTGIYYIDNGGFDFFTRLNRRILEKRVDKILAALRV
ncbi:MAG: dephospho-CoA kinase [Spirochaetaceae bacterium]|jgi:dephospho-CoA kinase|nr:dephospho-CoA kinase [Spirochaetaceae bacterium]